MEPGSSGGQNESKEPRESSDSGSGGMLSTTAPSASASAPKRTPSQSSITKPSTSHVPAHRQSFAENLRNAPSSPRSQRHPSFTQAAVQELLNHPPTSGKHANPRFAGRDWKDIKVKELVSQEDVKWVTLDSSVEEATMVGFKCPTTGTRRLILL